MEAGSFLIGSRRSPKEPRTHFWSGLETTSGRRRRARGLVRGPPRSGGARVGQEKGRAGPGREGGRGGRSRSPVAARSRDRRAGDPRAQGPPGQEGGGGGGPPGGGRRRLPRAGAG